jgi:hypothetical protein
MRKWPIQSKKDLPRRKEYFQAKGSEIQRVFINNLDKILNKQTKEKDQVILRQKS